MEVFSPRSKEFPWVSFKVIGPVMRIGPFGLRSTLTSAITLFLADVESGIIELSPLYVPGERETIPRLRLSEIGNASYG
jgi:hypothetical protein